jgi:hypothetical protein
MLIFFTGTQTSNNIIITSYICVLYCGSRRAISVSEVHKKAIQNYFSPNFTMNNIHAFFKIAAYSTRTFSNNFNYQYIGCSL